MGSPAFLLEETAVSSTRIILAIVCFLTASSIGSAQPNAVQDNARMDAMFRPYVNDLLQIELSCLRLVTDLTDEQRDTVLDNLAEKIDTWTDEAIAKSVDLFATPVLIRDQQDAISVEVKKILAPKAFQTYETDLVLRLSLIHI